MQLRSENSSLSLSLSLWYKLHKEKTEDNFVIRRPNYYQVKGKAATKFQVYDSLLTGHAYGLFQ
jgi:hypothetical protein